MMKSRKELDNDTIGRDIIEDYANFASKVYAGITRDGLSLDKIANKYEVQPIALTTYNGITELSNCNFINSRHHNKTKHFGNLC